VILSTHRNPAEPIRERFQSFASDLISPRIEINWEEETDKAARDFTASIASTCMFSTSKVTFSFLNSDLPDLNPLLRNKERLRKLWHETRDPACNTAVNWVMETIGRIARKRHLNCGKRK
jgi:hypothetical protein